MTAQRLADRARLPDAESGPVRNVNSSDTETSFGVRYHEGHVWKILRALRLEPRNAQVRQSPRCGNEEAQSAFVEVQEDRAAIKKKPENNDRHDRLALRRKRIEPLRSRIAGFAAPGRRAAPDAAPAGSSRHGPRDCARRSSSRISRATRVDSCATFTFGSIPCAIGEPWSSHRLSEGLGSPALTCPSDDRLADSACRRMRSPAWPCESSLNSRKATHRDGVFAGVLRRTPESGFGIHLGRTWKQHAVASKRRVSKDYWELDERARKTLSAHAPQTALDYRFLETVFKLCLD